MENLSDATIQKLAKTLITEYMKVAGRTLPPSQTRHHVSTRRESTSYTPDERRNARYAKNLGDAQKKLKKATDELTGLTQDQIKRTKKGKKALEKYNQALEDSAEFLKDSNSYYEKMIHESLGEQYRSFKAMSEASYGLSSEIAAAQRNSSFLAASLIESHKEITRGTEYYRLYISDLKRSISDLDKSYLEQAGFIDSTTDKLKQDIDPAQFARLRLKLGEAQTLLTENLSKIGIEDLSTLVVDGNKLKDRINAAASMGVESGEQFRDTLIMIAEQLRKQNYNISVDTTNLANVDYEELAKEIARISEMVNRSANNLSRSGRAANLLYGITAKNLSDLSNKSNAASAGLAIFSEKVTKKLLDSATIIASFAKAASAVKDIYKQAIDFNIAQVPATFYEVNMAAVKMGMSFEDTVKFLQENKRALAIYGVETGKTILDQTKTTFSNFGYNLKQASEVIGPTMESAIESGINIRNGDELNKFINQSLQSFKSISGIVNISAQEYMKLNAELLSSADTQGTLLGMDKDRANIYARQLVALRDNYVQMGLSTQQAQELVKAQQQQQREKVTSRVREAAKGMVLAQQLGLSPEESQRYFQLALKGNKSAEEFNQLQAISTRMGLASEQRRVQGYDQSLGAGFIVDTFLDVLKPSGALGTMMDQSMALNTATRAQTQLTAAEVARADAASAGNASLSKFSNSLNSLISLLDNNFSKLLIAFGTGLTAITVQSVLTAGALRLVQTSALAKAAGLDGALPSTATAGGKAGKIARIGGKVLGAAALGAAAYGGLSSINDTNTQVQSGQLSEKQGTVQNAKTLGALAGGGVAGAIGMGVGQALIPIPFLGAAIGGSIGAALGGWLGGAGSEAIADAVVDDIKSVSNAPVSNTSLADVNKINAAKQYESGILDVSDEITHDKLTQMVDKLTEAVSILKKMSEYSQQPISKNVLKTEENKSIPFREIPTALSYITGKSN